MTYDDRVPIPPASEPDAIAVRGPGVRLDLPHLCAQVQAAFRASGCAQVHLDVSAVTDPDLCTVDALARMQLTARRCGGQLLLNHVSPQLRELLVRSGLGDVLPLCPGSADGIGQAEQREQPVGVQERDDPADPDP